MRRSPHLVVGVTCAALLAACTSTVSGTGTSLRGSATPSGSAAAAAQPPAHFSDCSDAFNLAGLPFPPGRLGDLTFTCARISVPLDYSHASAGTIHLELVKVHDRNNVSGNSLVINPGGPGGSGVEAAIALSFQVADTLLTHFDLIGFDPRGVGLSTPVKCLTNKQEDAFNAASYDIRTAAGFAAAKAAAKQFADACNARYGASVDDYGTVQTAEDLDRIRQAIGAPQLNYLGFSYGTELGGVYAHLFPHNLRVAVLDGAVDPLTDPVTSFANQLAGFESAFDQFAADCRTKSSCNSLGDPRQDVYTIVAHATSGPIPSGTATDARSATPALILTGVIEALYSQDEWPTLAAAIRDGLAGRSEGLLKLADEYYQRSSDGSYSNLMDANTVISCNDSPPGPTDDQIRATVAQWVKQYPMFGLTSAQSLFSCQQWQPKRTPVPKPTAATPQKVLVIGNLHDPATPYQGAKDLTKTLGNAELLTWDGEGHTSYLGGSSCIDNYVNAYLISGALPPADTTCPR